MLDFACPMLYLCQQIHYLYSNQNAVEEEARKACSFFVPLSPGVPEPGAFLLFPRLSMPSRPLLRDVKSLASAQTDGCICPDRRLHFTEMSLSSGAVSSSS